MVALTSKLVQFKSEMFAQFSSEDSSHDYSFKTFINKCVIYITLIFNCVTLFETDEITFD